MRIIQNDHFWSLSLLAVGLDGLIVAASDVFAANPRIEAWDATSGERLWEYVPPYQARNTLAFVLDCSALVTASTDKVCLLKLRPNKAEAPSVEATKGTDVGWWGGAVVAGGDRVYVSRNERGAVALTAWTLPEFRPLWAIDRWPDYTQFDRGGAIDFVGERFAMPVNFGGTHPDFAVTIRTTDTGAEVGRVRLNGPARQLAFTVDGAKLLVRDDSRTVQVFDAASGARAGELVHRGRPFVTAVTVHPRGSVACARSDGTVTFWDADRLEAIRTLDWKAGKLVSLAFSPDGTIAAAGTEDGKVVVWDVDV